MSASHEWLSWRSAKEGEQSFKLDGRFRAIPMQPALLQGIGMRAGCLGSGMNQREVADDADRAVIGGRCIGVIHLVVDPAVELE